MADATRTQTAPAPIASAQPSPAAASPWKAGDRLGRYQLVAPLASGGMGVVFAARLTGAHGVERLVALKTLRPVTSPSDRAALLREARVTSRLHHKNVVGTIDLGEASDVPYVVMELVDGVSLARLVTSLRERREELSPELAAWIVMQAANGLHAAHELKDANGAPLSLVHRDVSPQNILLSTSGEVKIADFGIAKFEGREEATATGTIKGKFAYMAPEQANALPVDRRCDVFALGIVLWELLAFQRLFHAETPSQIILKIVHEPVRSPAELRPEVGEELAAIALTCLAKDPAARYATAAEVAESLRRVLRARAPVDESDLAKLIDRWFGAERREAMTQLTASVDGTTMTMAEPSQVVASPARAAPSRAARFGLAAAAFVVVVAAGAGVAWRMRPQPDAVSSPPPPVESAIAAAVPPEPTESAAPEPSPATPPSAAAEPAAPVVVAKPAPKPRSRPSPAPTPAPAPPKPSAGSGMFHTL